MGSCRGMKGNVEQAKSGRIKQTTLNEQYKAKDKEVKKNMWRDKIVWVDDKSAEAGAGEG